MLSIALATCLMGTPHAPPPSTARPPRSRAIVASRRDVDVSPCVADLDGDGVVGSDDLGRLLEAWATATADLDGDGITGPSDLGVLLGLWGGACEGTPDLSWIKVLIGEEVPPDASGIDEYIAKIRKLAPALEQIHLRFKPPPVADPDQMSGLIQSYASSVSKFRAAYGQSLEIGFHPDNSDGVACARWGCDSCDDWQCVLNASITVMNQINAIVDPDGNGTGIAIFSIEQSYVEDVGQDLSEIKACMTGACPAAFGGVASASPPVKFANVTGSYGGPDQYGPNGYDYAYPQSYNKGKKVPPTLSHLYQGGAPYFPAGTSSCIQGTPETLWVVDLDTPGAYSPQIPCPIGTSPANAYMTLSDGTVGASPDVAARYVAYLLALLPPISNQPDLDGSVVFRAFSGEETMLGGDGWTLENIAAFHADLQASFTELRSLAPSLFPAGGADPSTLEFAIWEFDPILENITLP